MGMPHAQIFTYDTKIIELDLILQFCLGMYSESWLGELADTENGCLASGSYLVFG